MLGLAGGEYILADMNPDETGNFQMKMEEFYVSAKNADYIIYIHNLGGKLETLEEFVVKNELLADFKAVQEGNVWCTTPGFFQISNTLGDMIADMHSMLTNTDPWLDSLLHPFRLKRGRSAKLRDLVKSRGIPVLLSAAEYLEACL